MNIQDNSSASPPPSFYTAEIAEQEKGKIVEISLRGTAKGSRPITVKTTEADRSAGLFEKCVTSFMHIFGAKVAFDVTTAEGTTRKVTVLERDLVHAIAKEKCPDLFTSTGSRDPSAMFRRSYNDKLFDRVGQAEAEVQRELHTKGLGKLLQESSQPNKRIKSTE